MQVSQVAFYATDPTTIPVSHAGSVLRAPAEDARPPSWCSGRTAEQGTEMAKKYFCKGKKPFVS